MNEIIFNETKQFPKHYSQIEKGRIFENEQSSNQFHPITYITNIDMYRLLFRSICVSTKEFALVSINVHPSYVACTFMLTNR